MRRLFSYIPYIIFLVLVIAVIFVFIKFDDNRLALQNRVTSLEKRVHWDGILKITDLEKRVIKLEQFAEKITELQRSHKARTPQEHAKIGSSQIDAEKK